MVIVSRDESLNWISHQENISLVFNFSFTNTHYREVWNVTAVSPEVYEVKVSGEDQPGERKFGKHL